MNVELLNPFTQNFPEAVVATLEDAALCLRYNSTGRFIAAGRFDGWTTIWDAETKGIIRTLEGHVKGVVSVSWSRNSKYLLTGSKDWNCVVWDLASGEREQTIRFDAPVSNAVFHPRNSKIIVVTLTTCQTFVVDLRQGVSPRRVELAEDVNVVTVGEQNGTAPVATNGASTNPKASITIARFSRDGKTIYAGTSQGTLLIFSSRNKSLLRRLKIANNCAVKHMEFNQSGSHLVMNSTDRIVRVYSIDKEPGSIIPTLEILHKLQDPIQRSPWNAVSFGGDAEYVLAGSGNIASHSIYIWDRTTGDLEKILEGPKEPLSDLDWHPLRPHIASLSVSGLIHLWGRHVHENYSAFAPGFEELDENIEYEERESEFDIEDEEEERRKRQQEEEEEVDIDTVDPLGGETLIRGQIPAAIPRAILPAATDEEDTWADGDADDDNEYDWFPPVRLDEEEEEEDAD